MLTRIASAAGRRVLASATSKLVATKLAPRSIISVYTGHGALPVRSFSVSALASAPAASKKTTSAATKKKPAKRSTPTKKKKKATKAAAPKKAKKTAKRALTPEEKEKAAIRVLKKMALLKGPQLLPESSWAVYVSQNLTAGSGPLTDKIKEVASAFKNLSASEKERLQATAQSNQAANKRARQQWIESYPPEAVYMANIARRRLARKLSKTRVYLIHDARLPKRAGSPYTLFIKSRFRSASDGGATSSQDAFRAMSQEWKNLSEADKQPFRDMAESQSSANKEQLKALKDRAKAYWKTHEGGSSSQVPS
ncbi:HMG box protein [Drechmeria coniospora]|uniref:HMG box protein n=1 Tax=Drechmeria coniospora TaxID=98403 RepID=A0A151GED6_DRECN|nr:HMG box protein [Drechmeria coniospora]KYK55431.1 HMG box protein [Drechmeria coniospora]ODA81962.1 hypothetical protein RJ55_00467 [Drechmeria coniospora]